MSLDDMEIASVTSMASAMLFGTMMFAAAGLATRAALVGDRKLFDMAANPRSSALDVRSLPSVYTLLYHFSVFGLILLYAYLAEYHPPFAHADKYYDADQFFFLTFLLFVVAFFTWKKHDHNEGAYGKIMKAKGNGEEDSLGEVSASSSVRHVVEANDKTEILNRDQTEEWKGWMQFMFLLYHYYHAEEVYNAIRIMITCYVWMTGFGNFSFFYLKADFSSVRVLQMLWRLNFLVLFLCLTQGTTYILYYICLLHTYYFFMVYITMRIGASKNHTKWWVRMKLMVLAVMIFLIWDCDLGLFKALHFPFFGETPKQGANGGSMWEWYFRSTLDHWSTFLGMIFALNFPICSLFYRKLEAQPLIWHVLGKGAVGAAFLAIFYAWVVGPFMQGKFDYNQTNAYYGFIPLYTYIYFRNLTPWLRNHTLDLLHQIGKTTLETYLMQHHIWLTSDAKSLLTLVPGWPKVNFLLVSLIYVFLSRRLYQLTLFLRAMVLPDNRNICLRNLGGMAAIISFYCLVAYLLDWQGMMNLDAVAVISVACGYVLYQFILDYTSLSNPAAITESETADRKSKSLPYLSGFLAVLCCGLVWHGMAMNGASKIVPLPATCAEHANSGQWMSLNGCHEGPRGEEYRKFGVSTVSTCSEQNEVKVWGWDDTESSSLCRFKQRDAKSLKKHLKGRTIYFIGDSITRYLYHSFCRQLGMKDAGAYSATEEKHQDIERKFGDITVSFLWAGFAPEMVQGAKNVTKYPINPPADTRKRPDLVVFGGGAWDKLWKFSTDTEQAELKSAYGDLATQMNELRKLNIPVVWLSPTTINSPALPSEDKRLKINEQEMTVVRGIHKTTRVHEAASFVIDGTAFTATRVSESFDGVHYPHQVYSAGAQILANAADWLLPEPLTGEPSPPKQPGEMSHVRLGLMMLGIALIGTMGFDAFFGFSYLAAIFVPGVAPVRMYYEAFSDLHRRKNLPPLEKSAGSEASSAGSTPSNSEDYEDEEIAGLVNNKTS